MKTKNTRRILLICLAVVLGLSILGVGVVFGIDAYVVNTTTDHLLTPEEASQLEDVDCILESRLTASAHSLPLCIQQQIARIPQR